VDRWWDRPLTFVIVALVAAAGVVSGVIGVVADGWWATGGVLVFQLMLTLAGGLLAINRETRGHAVRLVLAGAFVGVSSLQNQAVAATHTYWLQVGFTFQWVMLPLLVSVLISYPAARVEQRSHRVFVALVWAWALLPQLVGTLLWSPRANGWTGEALWWTVRAENVFAQGLSDIFLFALSALTGWLVAIEIGRWRRTYGLARTPVRIVACAGVLLAVGLLTRELLLHFAGRGQVPTDVPTWVSLMVSATGAVGAAALVVVALRAASRRGVVVEHLLAASGDARAVERVLRKELADPSLELQLLVDGEWIGTDDERPAAVPGGPRIVRDVLTEGDVVVARVDADAQVEGDPATLRVTLAAASMVLESTRLTLERELHAAELRASRARIVEAGAAQRRELERDLHDGAQQSLLAVSATLSRATLSTDPEEMRAAVGDAHAQLATALAELRRLARGIHPAPLSQGGLAAGLGGLASGVPGVSLRLGETVAGGARYPVAVESTAYYVVAEAVSNAVKHGGGSAIDVDVDATERELAVSVADEGPGGAWVEPAGGLAGLRDRVRALGGRFDVSSEVGAGTRVRAVLPLPTGAP
jgi:signal transduction histidine kinase